MLSINPEINKEELFSDFLEIYSLRQLDRITHQNTYNTAKIASNAFNFLTTYGQNDQVSLDMKLKAWFLIPKETARRFQFIFYSNSPGYVSPDLSKEVYEFLTLPEEGWRMRVFKDIFNLQFDANLAIKELYNEITKDTNLHMDEDSNVEYIEFLIRNCCAYLNHRDSNGKNLLHYAVANNKYFITKLLCKYDINVNQMDNENNTPLHLAIMNKGDEEIVKLLIDYNANLSMLNKQGFAPIHLACNNYVLSLIELLYICGVDISQPDLNGNTPLHLMVKARSEQSLDVIKLLIHYNADTNKKNHNENTPLHLATLTTNPQIEIAKLLIESGAELSLSNKYGETPSWYLKNANIFPEIKQNKYESEFHFRTMLSNIWSINHESDLGGATINFSGGRSRVGSAELIRLFNIFCHQLGNTQTKRYLLERIREIDQGVEKGKKSAQEIVTSFHEGETIVLSSGWIGHSIDLLIHDNYLLIANRGDGHRTTSVKIYNIDRNSRLTKDDIDVIKTSSQSKTVMKKFIYNDLPLLLGYNPRKSDELSELFHENILFKLQKARNCWWVSPKTSLFGYLLLKVLLDNQSHSTRGEVLNALDRDIKISCINLIYKEYTAFCRLYMLKEYLQKPRDGTPRDHQLVKKIVAKMVDDSEKWNEFFTNSNLVDFEELENLLKAYREDYNLDKNFEKTAS